MGKCQALAAPRTLPCIPSILFFPLLGDREHTETPAAASMHSWMGRVLPALIFIHFSILGTR